MSDSHLPRSMRTKRQLREGSYSREAQRRSKLKQRYGKPGIIDKELARTAERLMMLGGIKHEMMQKG